MRPVKEMVLGALLGIVVTGSGSWLVFGADKVTRQEMREHVENNSPWARERGGVLSSLRSVEAQVEALRAKLDQVAEAQVQMLVELKLTSQKVDRLLNQKER